MDTPPLFSSREVCRVVGMNSLDSKCKRCDYGTLRRWDDLDEEQQEVALRLPRSADFSLDERKARHRWCTRCWYEDTGDGVRNA